MKSLKAALLFFILFQCFSNIFSQQSISDSSITMGMVSFGYEASVPAMDLAERFGYTNFICLGGGIKHSSNWYLSSGVNLMFGKDVLEKVAENVTTEITNANGLTSTMILGADGRYYLVRFWERGMAIPLVVGKIIPVSKSANPNSGIYIEAGPQYFQHRIRLDVVGNNIPNMSDDFLKGYDRLTGGFGATEGIGYRYFGKNKLVNFYLGVHFSQNFTKSLRSFNYDLGYAETQQRQDFTYGVRIGWTFPIYQAAAEGFSAF